MINRINLIRKNNNYKDILNSFKHKEQKQIKRLMRSMLNKRNSKIDWLKYKEDKNYYKRKVANYKKDRH